MIRNVSYLLTVMLLLCVRLYAQDGYNERAKKYIEKYYPLAIAEQRASGIPASIILGQGILETEAGSSELMTMANNHFGIKCKNGWQGDTFLHTDDAKDECFKKYKTAEESYKDHSAHLLNNPRYSPLFKCSKTDYAAWAVGLKRCGYATNPQYAQRLIKIIEDFKLQEFTYTALDSYMLRTYPYGLTDESSNTAFMEKGAPQKKEYVKDTTHGVSSMRDTAKTLASLAALGDTSKRDSSAQANTVTGMADSAKELMTHEQEQALIHAAAASDTGRILIVNGLKAFFAHKGEALLEYAVKYKIRYPRLLELNDLSDAPLPFDMYVYLEKKLTSGTHDKHTVKDGETMLMIAQVEGMQLKWLASLNMLAPGQEPLTGAVLELQAPPGQKPIAKLLGPKTYRGNTADKDSVTDSNWTAAYKPPVYSSLDNNTDTAKEKKELPPPPPGNHDVAVSYGTSFAAPADEKTDSANGYIATNKNRLPSPKNIPDRKPKVEDRNPATGSSAKMDSSSNKDRSGLKTDLDKPVYAEAPKASVMKSDPEQPQLKKLPVEKEYKKGDKYYIVKRGDTAYSIAKRNEVTVAQLLKWNDTEPQDIKAGQTLRVKE